jgi:hypothetical protein
MYAQILFYPFGTKLSYDNHMKHDQAHGALVFGPRSIKLMPYHDFVRDFCLGSACAIEAYLPHHASDYFLNADTILWGATNMLVP